MGRINVLPRHIAELIAAGEVVERPSSVVKEIMENSIDAGSKNVTIEIKHGGITYIRITDDGCGMDAEDVRKAFISHATSKIATEEDLAGIGTLGFRGEALASIAAVAKVEVMTRPYGDIMGTRYSIEGGEEKELSEAGCPAGTTLIIRDIFYNTPARMKFLKKDVTEGNSVAGVVDRIALSHPEVSIRFIRDGKQQLLTPGNGKLGDTIYAIFGREFAMGLLPVDYNLSGVGVKGYISKCHMLIAARTHASIAGYSNCIPTLVLGYSVKSKGIATDIFGKYENYVLPVSDILSSNDILNHFKYFETHHGQIKKHLETFIPEYKHKCYQIKDIIKELCNE